MATMQKTRHEPNQFDVKTWEATVTEEKTLKITRIVHSCVLIDLGGRQVLTDPWFSEKMGYHFGEELGMSVESLPPLSGVVVSHDHPDHNDMKSIRRQSRATYLRRQGGCKSETGRVRKCDCAGHVGRSFDWAG